jgi:hypothetical protein
MKFVFAFLAVVFTASLSNAATITPSCAERIVDNVNWNTCCIPPRQYNQLNRVMTCREVLDTRQLGKCQSAPTYEGNNAQIALRLASRALTNNCCAKLRPC